MCGWLEQVFPNRRYFTLAAGVNFVRCSPPECANMQQRAVNQFITGASASPKIGGIGPARGSGWFCKRSSLRPFPTYIAQAVGLNTLEQLPEMKSYLKLKMELRTNRLYFIFATDPPPPLECTPTKTTQARPTQTTNDQK
eukprot:5165402-Amphidinium_carterae.1